MPSSILRSPSTTLRVLACLALAVVACGSSNETGGSQESDRGGSQEPGGQGPAPSPPKPIEGVACDGGLGGTPLLANVTGVVRNDAVEITFDPFDDARDYRVYVLPAEGDMIAGPNESFAVRNATYRCGGERTASRAITEDEPMPQSYGVKTRIDTTVLGFKRNAADATLGYVYTKPGDGRVPVYAMGSSAESADNECFHSRWSASRTKEYTKDPARRTARLAQHDRDDGIVFYVPAAAGTTTKPVYTAVIDEARLYVVDGPEKGERQGASVAFDILRAPEADTAPLMRVFYEKACGKPHDELAVGKSRFERAYKQGNQPVWNLHWSGLEKKTTLVVEALDSQCPYQGHMTATSRPAEKQTFGDGANQFTIDYPAFQTVDEIRKASSTGEVFVNGQGPAANRPRPIARACVQVEPTPMPKMDWSATFDAPETLGTPTDNGFQTWLASSQNFDVSLEALSTGVWSFGTNLGELWVTTGDWAGDVSGKIRMTAKEKATVTAGKFVHTTFQVDTFSSGRRYPQLILSDRSAPVQENMAEGRSIIVQTIGEQPVDLQVQVCDHVRWDVQEQCPGWSFHHMTTPGGEILAPSAEVIDQAGRDRLNKLDVYASPSRVYVFYDDKPFGCADLPANALEPGPTTVTFGHVLYHSGADLVGDWMTFYNQHEQMVTARRWDNLGFSSNVDAPTWDTSRMPCRTAGSMSVQ